MKLRDLMQGVKLIRMLGFALVLGLLFESISSQAGTPYLDCDHAGRSSAFVGLNNAANCLDAAFNDADTLAVFTSDANASLTAKQLTGGFLLNITSTTTLTDTRTLDLPDGIERVFAIKNSTTGGQEITVTQGTGGTTVRLFSGVATVVYVDGVNVKDVSFAGLGGPSLAVPASGDRLPIYDPVGAIWAWVDIDNYPSGGSSGNTLIAKTGWVEIDRKTASAASTVNFTFDPTLYDQIVLYFYDVIASAADDELAFRFSINSGLSWESDSGDYGWNVETDLASATSIATHGVNGSNTAEGLPSTLSYGWQNNIQTAAPSTLTGSLEVHNASSTSYRTTWRLKAEGTQSTSAAHNRTLMATGIYAEGVDDIDGIQVFSLNGGVTISGEFILVGLLTDPGADTFNQLTTTDATVTDLWTLVLATGTSAQATATVNAKKSSGEVYTAKIVQTCRNASGTVACATQSRTELELGSVTGSVDASLTADTGAGAIDLDVTGASSETWEWQAVVEWIKQ